MNEVTDIQQARAIIKTVGEVYQQELISRLQWAATYNLNATKNEIKACKVISNMEGEYALNIANVLWADKHDEIPDYIKNYSCSPVREESHGTV